MDVAEPGSELPLLGRAAEVAALQAVVDGVYLGRSGVVVVEGEPGIGKSRLLAAILTSSRQRGARVCASACDEDGRGGPLGVLLDALSIDRRPSVGEGEDRGVLLVELALDDLERSASTGAVILVIEDLHWADPLTLRALPTIVGHTRNLPIAIMLSVRRGPRDRGVDRAISNVLDRGATHLRLGPLEPAHVAELTEAVVGRPAGPGLLAQVHGAGGNPLFVVELVRALADGGAIDERDGLADAHPASSPPSLRLTILRRLSLLPGDTLMLLRFASVLGSTFTVRELGGVTERTTAQLVPDLVAAVDAGLLVESGERLTFAHGLVRDAIYHDLPLAVRKGMHRQAGQVLGDHGASIERTADHVGIGAEIGDASAVAVLRAAADAAVVTAPAIAVRLLERAFEIAGIDGPGDEVAADLIGPLLAMGESRRAEALARHVLSRGPPLAVEITTRRALANVLAMGARYPEAIEQLARAATVAPEPQRPALVAANTVMMVLDGRVEQARVAAREVVDAGEWGRDDHAVCLGSQALAMIALAEGSVDEAIVRSRRAVTAVERDGAPWTSVPHLWLGTSLSEGDQLVEAERVLHTGRALAERAGDVTRVVLYQWAIAEVRLAAGDWDDAVAEALAGLDVVEESTARVGAAFAHAVCAHVAFHRGDRAVAAAAVDEAHRLVAGPLEIGFEWTAWIEALLLEGEGRPAQALSILEHAWDVGAPLRYLQVMSRAMAPDLVRMAVAAGDRDGARAVSDEMARVARRTATPTARGIALRCQGLAHDDPSSHLEAVAAHREGPRPYALGAACEDAGTSLGRRSSRAAAPLLIEAAAIYQRLDAGHDLDRVHAVGAALGLPPTPARQRRPTFGWDSLTPTEHLVVAAVAQGLTNREVAETMCVSRRTVATHLEHVFQKLGHANRVELAADVARRGVTSAPPASRTAPGAGPATPQTRPPAPRRG